MGTSPEDSVVDPRPSRLGRREPVRRRRQRLPDPGIGKPGAHDHGALLAARRAAERQEGERTAPPAVPPARAPWLCALVAGASGGPVRPPTKTGVRVSRGNHPEVVVVTGASGGVGRAIAHSFASSGAHIGLLARGTEGLDGDQAARSRRSAARRSLCRPTSPITSRSRQRRRQSKRDSERSTFGSTTRCRPCSPASSTPSRRSSKRATEVTYLGTVYGTMAALKRMRPRDRGKIVQVGSALAYRAIPLQAAYCGAKFGIRGFTDSIRTELLHEQQHGADHDGPAARRQHDAVQLVSLEAARAPDTGPADLPARDPRRGCLLGSPPSPP